MRIHLHIVTAYIPRKAKEPIFNDKVFKINLALTFKDIALEHSS